jgi:hypothetical protein
MINPGKAKVIAGISKLVVDEVRFDPKETAF